MLVVVQKCAKKKGTHWSGIVAITGPRDDKPPGGSGILSGRWISEFFR